MLDGEQMATSSRPFYISFLDLDVLKGLKEVAPRASPFRATKVFP